MNNKKYIEMKNKYLNSKWFINTLEEEIYVRFIDEEWKEEDKNIKRLIECCKIWFEEWFYEDNFIEIEEIEEEEKQQELEKFHNFLDHKYKGEFQNFIKDINWLEFIKKHKMIDLNEFK